MTKSPARCALALIFCSPAWSIASPISLKGNGAEFLIERQSLALDCRFDDGTEMQISDGCPGGDGMVEEVSTTSWNLAGRSFSAELTPGGALAITITAPRNEILLWPSMALAKSDELIWPRAEGAIIPLDDEDWVNELAANEWNTLEGISMPFWGVQRSDATISVLVSTQFRNTIVFAQGNEGLRMQFAHDFNAKSKERAITFRFHVEKDASPVAPAVHFRNWLKERGQFVTLADKAAAVPGVEKLLGATHAYIWDEGIFSRYDILKNRWKSFAQRLIEESKTEGTVGSFLIRHFDAEQERALEECAAAEWPYDYLKSQIASGLSDALAANDFARWPCWKNEKIEGEAPTGLDAEAANLYKNAMLLSSAYPADIASPKDWGNGVSLRMLRKLDEAGLDRLKLCTPGWEVIQLRPWVADEAAKRGWLIGTYDSYHSIHDPKLAGTDATWGTAQMTPELYETGGIMRAGESYYHGFKGIGRKLNPIAARPFVESRVNEIFTAIPFNYSFIDCDAFGEVYDDFSPAHPMSMEEDAAERASRLMWIGKAHNAVVGSEGGSAYAVPAIMVAEGILTPFFGWDDADMKDPKSPYFRGKYYPADGPAVNFKPVPIKEKFRKLLYDPRYRLPLYETVYHDSVVAVSHWSNADFKYPEVTPILELTEMLYLCPPIYHLNLDEFDRRREAIMKQYGRWSPVHREFGFAAMTNFAWLTVDRLVQAAEFEGGLRVVVNFSQTAYRVGPSVVPAMNCLIERNGKNPAPSPLPSSGQDPARH